MAGRHDAVELKLLRAFVLLAEELNFGRAAERLHVTQPALSAQIRQLEQRLGLALFIRSTRRVGLTAEGTALLQPARSLLAESARFGEAVDQVRGRPERRLIFGAALYTLGIRERQQLLDGFIDRHPHIRFTVLPLWQREMARALLREEADLALMLGVAVPLAQWEAEPTAEVIFPDTLPRLVLRRERIGLLTPRASPLGQYDEIEPSMLQGQSVAMLGGTHGGAILGPLRAVLGAGGASLIVPPEPHAIGVERYARRFQIPAVSLGWFDNGGDGDPEMVRSYVVGLELATELALVRSPGNSKAATQLFWEEARARFPDAEFVPGRA
jgi:DNA-binding transcriptional LysR family regulator